ncbi:putative membrane-fusion protein-like protein [Magnetofaba australis IT-1]|uniref:Putative membrane-fusion protein-like protein n=2 Tax=Magnetofaba TaxID=1472292 RepID=A0A1Y2K420_9PROT|nr:putative membrane-fusion protein-like protein [Magnetofaba australis IT-1]
MALESGLESASNCVTEPLRQAKLAFPISGRVAEKRVKEGQRVKRGEVIYLLERRREQLEEKRAKLLLEDRSALNGARAREQMLGKQLTINRRLFERNQSISREELDKLILEHELALQEHARLVNEKRRQKVDHALAAESLRLRALSAPIDGVAASLKFEPGEMIDANQLAAHLVDVRSGVAVCHVEDQLARRLPVGAQVSLRILSGAPVMRRGEVIFAAPLMDPSSGLRRVKIAFENTDNAVILGAPAAIDGVTP